MITTTNEEHKLELNELQGVIDLLTKALNDSKFKSFHAYTTNEWPVGMTTKKVVYTVAVEKCHATNS